jgi:hypothetical protein
MSGALNGLASGNSRREDERSAGFGMPIWPLHKVWSSSTGNGLPSATASPLSMSPTSTSRPKRMRNSSSSTPPDFTLTEAVARVRLESGTFAKNYLKQRRNDSERRTAIDPKSARRRAGFASKELIQKTIRSEQSGGPQ